MAVSPSSPLIINPKTICFGAASGPDKTSEIRAGLSAQHPESVDDGCETAGEEPDTNTQTDRHGEM